MIGTGSAAVRYKVPVSGSDAREGVGAGSRSLEFARRPGRQWVVLYLRSCVSPLFGPLRRDCAGTADSLDWTGMEIYIHISYVT